MAKLQFIWNQIVDSVGQGIIALGIGLILFTMLERMFQFSPAKKSWRANYLDLQYALLSMLYPPFLYFILAVIFGWLSVQMRAATHDDGLPPAWFGAQLLGMLLARDILIYIRHRIFHTRPVWAFHSIHHSSEEVNWLSAVRFHPAENLIEAAGETLLFLACQQLGVDSLVLAVAGITIGFYNFFIHSNLRWTFGPLKFLFVSPVFHRWHHSDAPAAQDKNFAAMFSCLDLICGTFYMPKDIAPDTLGLSGEERAVHPRSLFSQIFYPFRKR